jgi:hypothetical protein
VHAYGCEATSSYWWCSAHSARCVAAK